MLVNRPKRKRPITFPPPADATETPSAPLEAATATPKAKRKAKPAAKKTARPIHAKPARVQPLDLRAELSKIIPDITVPETFSRATPKNLASGAYQRKLLTLFAPILIPELLNSLRINVRCGEAQAQKLAADVFGLTPSKGGGVNLFMNQQNINQGKPGSESTRINGPTTPDEMFRQLATEREQRRINAGAVIDLVATPIGEYDKDKLIQGE